MHTRNISAILRFSLPSALKSFCLDAAAPLFGGFLLYSRSWNSGNGSQ